MGETQTSNIQGPTFNEWRRSQTCRSSVFDRRGVGVVCRFIRGAGSTLQPCGSRGFLDSRSPLNISGPRRGAALFLVASRRCRTILCAFGFRLIVGGASVPAARISPVISGNAFVPLSVPVFVRRTFGRGRRRNGFCPGAATARKTRECVWRPGQCG
jgi:hypothetical protein